jgi:flagellar protein FlaG
MTMKPAAESRQRAGFGPIRFDSLKPDELRAVLESVGEAVESLNPNVQFRVDDSTGQLLTQIVDRDTGQVVRQIPTEEAVRALSRLNEFVGLLFDQAG